MAQIEAPKGPDPAYLVIDTESIPDGKLLARAKFGEPNLPPEQAIARAQEEARESSATGSDFLPVTYQVPVAACVLRVGADFSLQQVTCLDAPQFRPRKIVESFWEGASRYLSKFRGRVRLVTFNGRGFDLPLLELAAFRYGISAREHFADRRRFDGYHLDLLDWLTNYGAIRLSGGLNLLSKLLGKPGKMDLKGDQVYRLYQEGRLQEINDYCMFDTLDTFFVFLRSQVLTGELTLEDEHKKVLHARLAGSPHWRVASLAQYLDNWGDWDPWP